MAGHIIIPGRHAQRLQTLEGSHKSQSHPWQQVTNKKRWARIARALGAPDSMTDKSTVAKRIYQLSLADFEKVQDTCPCSYSTFFFAFDLDSCEKTSLSGLDTDNPGLVNLNLSLHAQNEQACILQEQLNDRGLNALL